MTEFPLSFGQQRLWFLDQLDPGDASYNMPFVRRLRGRLVPGALVRAIDEIASRHEPLRARFPGDRPVQIVDPATNHRLQRVDLSDLPAPSRDDRARQLVAGWTNEPFDLAHGPVLRVHLVRLAADDHVLCVVLHHIVADGWSLGVFARELGALYDAYVNGRPSPLPAVPMRYGDFAISERRRAGDLVDENLAYWRTQLANVPVLELPCDRPRSESGVPEGGFHQLRLPAELAAGIERLGRGQRCTLFMTLLAAYQALLARHTGQYDICVGSSIAGRDREELEPLIGYLINTLVLRGDLSGDPTFSELLTRTRAAVLGAYAHQQIPLEQLTSELRLAPDLKHKPLFQTMFILQDLGDGHDDFALPGVAVREFEEGFAQAKFDLMLEAWTEAGDLVLCFTYSMDRFERDTVVRLGERVRALLEGAVANPDARLSTLPLVSECELEELRGQVAVGVGGALDPDPPASVHELFEAQALRTLDAVAVEAGTDALTYGQLDARANRLSRVLRRGGVGAEAVVGVCVERSIEMVVGLLAVWKAGGAYLPLDPSYPRERLTLMIEDAGARLVLTQRRTEDLLPRGKFVRLRLDDVGPAEAESSDPLEPSGSLASLAYVIYTSGSTGHPKGVAVEHRSLAARVTWMRENYGLRSEDRVLQFAALSFDTHAEEIYPCLVAGATLVLAPATHHSLPEFLSGERGRELTVLDLPTPYWHQLVSELEAVPWPASLRLLILGADQVNASALAAWRARFGDRIRVVNSYGPTETTIIATTAELTPTEPAGRPPIGRPLAHTQTYVLDEALRPQPSGATGELFIGGTGVARGYLNRPQLTAERFLANPFGPGRLYRTGDRVRVRRDGQLEFLGRLDDQVKVRGYRIEPGEIEARLGEHPRLSQSTVVAHDGRAGDKRLVAYVVAKGDVPPSTSELRTFLRQALPEHAVPAAYVNLEALPLTVNGKVDRNALPLPDRSEPVADHVAPIGNLEEALAAIWSEVLGLDRIPPGRHDNFFELGGDSILSLQVISRARKRGLMLTPKQVFEHQTVAGLAAVAEQESRLDPRAQGPVEGDVPLTPIQRWFFERELPEPHHFNQSVLLGMPSVVPELVEQVLGHLTAHHDALRLRFSRDGSGWRQENAADQLATSVFGGVIDISDVDADDQPAAIDRRAGELQASLDLRHGPLLRAALFDLGRDEPKRLLIAINHLAVDGVSWRILLDDFTTVYRQLGAGEAPVLPPKTSSFKHWAERLQQRAVSEPQRRELDFWLSQLDAPHGSLPLDQLGHANTVASSDEVSVRLSPDETEMLLRAVPRAYGAQIVEALLAPLVGTLARWSGTSSVLVDVEGHGREPLFPEIDLHRTVGWFTSLFPARFHLDDVDAIGTSLTAVKETLRGMPSRGIGFGLLRYLNPETAPSLAALPTGAVSFNYLGQFGQESDGSPLFTEVPEGGGSEHSDNGLRSYVLDVNSVIAAGQLTVHFGYSSNLHERATIELLAAEYLTSLRALIEHCGSRRARAYSPSDFPLAGLDQRTLDKIVGT